MVFFWVFILFAAVAVSAYAVIMKRGGDYPSVSSFMLGMQQVLSMFILFLFMILAIRFDGFRVRGMFMHQFFFFDFLSVNLYIAMNIIFIRKNRNFKLSDLSVIKCFAQIFAPAVLFTVSEVLIALLLADSYRGLCLTIIKVNSWQIFFKGIYLGAGLTIFREMLVRE